MYFVKQTIINGVDVEGGDVWLSLLAGLLADHLENEVIRQTKLGNLLSFGPLE